MKVKLKDIKSNPYRNIEHYPINPEKVEALKKSIEKTGWWENLIGREVDGEIQIAYGHHRVSALRQIKNENFEFNLPIKNLDDGTMIQIMANENMQEWEHSIAVTDETVKVAKEFLENESVPGTEVSGKKISNFLGWNARKVTESLRRMNLIEDGTISKDAVLTFESERKAEYFTSAIQKAKEKNIKFTPKEQEAIANELVEKDVSRGDIKKVIEAKAFTKKFGDDFGKKKAEKKDSRVLRFDHELLKIGSQFTDLKYVLKKLIVMHNEIKSISDKRGMENVGMLFLSINGLEEQISKFKNVMLEDEGITKEYKEEIKQLN